MKLQLSDADQKALDESGYVGRWINDQDGRIEQALAGGYIFMKPDEARSVGVTEIHQGNSDLGGKVSKIVSRGEARQIRAFLMKIQKEFYDADQLEKEKVNQRVDEALAGGEAGGAGIENKYGPGVTYSK
jgi:hypothetical protein